MTCDTIVPSTLIARCCLPRDMVSYNRCNGAHWASKLKSTQQKKNIWGPWLRSSEGLDIPVQQGKHKRLIRISRVISGRMRLFEPVNLWAGAKPIEDALVDLGWLEDDDQKHCELKVEQFRVESAVSWIKKAVVENQGKVAVEVFDLDVST